MIINRIPRAFTAPIEGGATYTEMFETITPTATGWNEYDIETNNGVPKGAIAEIICYNDNTTSATQAGVRTDGSLIDRRLDLSHGATGDVCLRMFVKVHETTGLIEIYAENTTKIRFYILGYWEGVDFTEQMNTYEPTTNNAWVLDFDVATPYSIPANAVTDVALMNTSVGARNGGVRNSDATLSRLIDLGGRASGNGQFANMCVKVNASGYIDYYSEIFNGDDVHLVFLGYFDSNMDYVEAFDTYNASGDGAWEDEDISASLDQDGRVAEILMLNYTGSTTGQTMGVREQGGEVGDRFIDVSRNVGGEYFGYTSCVLTDSSGVIDIYAETSASTDFMCLGYFK